MRIARVDRDTMAHKGEMEDVLLKFAGGGLDMLVGTQMIAKGHDFPNVTLVGVISVDIGLGLPDLRSAERTFQLITQVAGRAGRGKRAGKVLIQTYYPSITLCDTPRIRTMTRSTKKRSSSASGSVIRHSLSSRACSSSTATMPMRQRTQTFFDGHSTKQTPHGRPAYLAPHRRHYFV